MLDVVGDHGGSTDGFNDDVGLLEGCTDNESIDEGRDESVGCTELHDMNKVIGCFIYH
jgi:hypothetical protein